MASDDFWTSPADRIVRGTMGHCNLTVLQPPFDVDIRTLAVNDPGRAAQFAAVISTVERVVEHLGPQSAMHTPEPGTRADLDIVQAGAWGNVLGVFDPAFASDGNDAPLRYEAERVRELFPDARIVGRVSFHGGAEHTEDIVWLPDGAMFHACGWPGDEPFVIDGDPDAVIASLGLDAQVLDDAGIDLAGEEPNETEWALLAALALGEADPWSRPEPQAAALRVRHDESAVRSMENLYFI